MAEQTIDDAQLAITPANRPGVLVVPSPSAVIETPWLQMPNEPLRWYVRFMTYFLPFGPSRTLTRAYLAYLAAERPNAVGLKKTANTVRGAVSWQHACHDWQWRQRAEAFDRLNLLEYVTLVDKARDKIMRSMEDAADALADALTIPRLKVSAAKEILDRGGLPGTTNIGVSRIEPYTADELHKAEQEVAAWEKDTYGGNQDP
jgi:hypothetical protein